mmetsp:Transcript_5883/g.26048  ORF Transcript_5883/g.26048 Transcript_5883/m.26048 type:complete len:231 (-) Transcript_5883:980-1672(-)
MAFFMRITPAFTACWFASALVFASASALAASTNARIPSTSALVSASSFRSTPADSYASAAAVVDALADDVASNSFVFHRWSSSWILTFSISACSAAFCALAAAMARSSFSARTSSILASSLAYSSAFCPCLPNSASSAASASSARLIARWTTRSTSLRARSNHAPRFASSSILASAISFRSAAISVSVSFSRIRKTMLSAVSLATPSLCLAADVSAFSARSRAFAKLALA